jgi:hypothetical protein
VAPLIANFLEMRGDTLLFFEEGAGRGIWSVTADKLQRLETSVGHRNMHRPHIVQGAAIGAGAGLVGGLVFAAVFTPSDPGREYSFPLTALVGSLVGAGAGAVVGSRRTAEQWAVVPLPPRMSTRAGAAGFSITFRF